jgi:hypothetical protein
MLPHACRRASCPSRFAGIVEAGQLLPAAVLVVPDQIDIEVYPSRRRFCARRLESRR